MGASSGATLGFAIAESLQHNDLRPGATIMAGAIGVGGIVFTAVESYRNGREADRAITTSETPARRGMRQKRIIRRTTSG